MTLQIQQIIKHLFQADSLEEVPRERLEELVRQYPAFNVGRYLLSKKLQAEQADHFAEETRKTNLYFTNPYWLQWLLDSTEDGPVTLSRNSWREETPAREEAEELQEEPRQEPKAAAGQEEPVVEEFRSRPWQRVQMEESLGLEEPPAAPAPWEEPAPVSPEEPKTTPWEESEAADLGEPTTAAWENPGEEPVGEETEAPSIPESELIAETGGTVEPKQEDTRFIEAIEEETAFLEEGPAESSLETPLEAPREVQAESQVPVIDAGIQDSDPNEDSTGTGLLDNPVFAYRRPRGEGWEALQELPGQPETAEQTEQAHQEENPAPESEPVHHPEEMISAEEAHQAAESVHTAAEEPQMEAGSQPDLDPNPEPLLTAEAASPIEGEEAGGEKTPVPGISEIQPDVQQAGNPETPPESKDPSVGGGKTPSAVSKEPALVIDPYHTIDYFASQGIRFVQEENPKDKLGQQLKSFTEWLKVMKRLPQKQESPTPDPATEHRILAFAAHSNETREVVTETMAEVLAMQGMSEKAAEVYRKLSLLNPAKSAYFAAKIEQLKVK